MARNRSSAQKTQAKTAFIQRLRDGVEVIASRLLANGQSIVYRASVKVDDEGRVELIALGAYRAKLPFRASIDKQVPGYPDWFIISGIPVCVAGRYTSIFAAIMRMAPYSD
jgi:hypothetical protein